MRSAYLNNPHNLWGKWAKLPPFRQHATLLLLGTGLLYYPASDCFRIWREVRVTEAELRPQQEKLEHQQQILRTLKQKSEAATLTPELAAQLPPVNELVQKLADGLHVGDSQWTFKAQPALNLQIQGDFIKMKLFLTALLAQTPQLGLTRLHIYKAEEESGFSVTGDIAFQLQTRKENP